MFFRKRVIILWSVGDFCSIGKFLRVFFLGKPQIKIKKPEMKTLHCLKQTHYRKNLMRLVVIQCDFPKTRISRSSKNLQLVQFKCLDGFYCFIEKKIVMFFLPGFVKSQKTYWKQNLPSPLYSLPSQRHAQEIQQKNSYVLKRT